MKKILLTIGVIFLAGVAWAGVIQRISKISMATATQISAPSVATIAAVAGQRNCINNLDIKSLGEYQLQILTGTTTDYAIIMSSGQSLVRSWAEDDAICGEANESITIKVTTITSGTFEINYGGFRY
jgi:hypothetical protein